MVDFTNLIDYANIRDSAWLFLINNNVRSLPLDMDAVSRQNDWLVLLFEDNVDVAVALDKGNLHNTCEGWSCVYKGRIFIFYRYTDNKGRCRFTIAHEFGHVVLLHLDKLKTDEYEREANMFAARILMPMCVLKECNAISAAAISKLCGTSLTAAAYRAKRLNELLQRGKFYTSPYEVQLKKQFDDFIVENKNIKECYYD